MAENSNEVTKGTRFFELKDIQILKNVYAVWFYTNLYMN